MSAHNVKNAFEVAAVFVAFALLHSLCLAAAVKTLARRLFGPVFTEVFYRFAYTCLSMVTLMAALYLIRQIPDTVRFILPPPLKVIFISLQVAGCVFLALPFRRINVFEFTGVYQIYRYFKFGLPEGTEGISASISASNLITGGIYGVVRHPLYFGGILVVTFNTYLTMNAVTLSLLSVLYFIAGSMLEEKRLRSEFGESYVEYQKAVPRLLPSLSGLRGLLGKG